MQLSINGSVHQVDGPVLEMRLIDFLREELDLIGTKNGCDIGVCGSCTVLADLKPLKACNRKVRDVVGKELLTIEGLRSDGARPHPLQEAFVDHGAVQCGFCIPGMVLAAHALLSKSPDASRPQIRKAISPNLCRCTGYQQIIDAIETAAHSYRSPRPMERS